MQGLSSIDRVWIAVFGIWLVLLSGILNRWTSSPGMLQWWSISRLASARHETVAQIETRIMELSSEQTRLEKSPVAQRREIRRVLGYLASDEILFDFSADLIQPQFARRN